MKNICIIGAGAAGILLLLLLNKNGVDLSTVTVIDPHFDGGDLARKWSAVMSNTPWSKTFNALQKHFPELNIKSDKEPDMTTKLVEISHLLLNICKPILSKVKQVHGYVTSCSYNTDEAKWTVTYDISGKQGTTTCEKLVFTQGSRPRMLNLPIRSIPLDIALDTSRLTNIVKSGEKVIIFGTMHSGTLVIRNCAALGMDTTAYYNSERPFYWDRDGSYDGIKGEAADIADSIVSSVIPVKLLNILDTEGVIRTSREADWVIYSMGFSPRNDITVSVNGNIRQHTAYDSASGCLNIDAPAWGFGIAYPNRAPDGIHWDVGVSPFLEHMALQIPKLLE